MASQVQVINFMRMSSAELRAWLAARAARPIGAAYEAARYELRVRELEAEGLTRSDAQGVADAEGL